MDLKQHHDVVYGNGGRPKVPSSVIKSEPRSISPCYSQADEVLRNPPKPSGSGGLFSGIAGNNRLRQPDDWLTPRSPVTITMPPNSASSSGSTNLSPSPGPAMHPGIYPSTSNGYPSPTMSTSSYDLYPGSKLSKYCFLLFELGSVDYKISLVSMRCKYCRLIRVDFSLEIHLN